MSGHSKWATIKRKKAANDAARGRQFTRCIRELTIAARAGGGDPAGNPRLRTAIAAAKAVNMPNDNIDRAIKKGTGELDGMVVEEILYEGYGPFGVAVMAEVMTDNRNRTAAEVRHVFTKYGGNLGETGCVAWMFDQKGIIQVEKSRVDEETLLEAAMEAGAEDVQSDDEETYRVVTAVVDFSGVISELESRGIPMKEASLERIPRMGKELGEDEAGKFLKFYEMLEELEDVQKLFANFEISDEILEKLEG